MKQKSLLFRKCLMRLKLLLYGAAFLFWADVQAQDISISGTVTSSEDNLGIPGVR